MRYWRRRTRVRRRILAGAVLVVLAAAGGWWYFRGQGRTTDSDEPQFPAPTDQTAHWAQSTPQTSSPEPAKVDQVALAADEQVLVPAEPAQAQPASDPPQQSALPSNQADPDQPDRYPPSAGPTRDPMPSGNRSIEEARRLMEGGKLIEARHRLNALLKEPLTETENAEVRAVLRRLADETLFSRRIMPGDPLVETYTVAPGDALVNIGPRYGVPAEILATINGLPDPNRIRAGQQLKVLRGPFHARIYKSKFRLDIYLGDLYVRSCPVGLGNQGATPEGVWRVKNRLQNPRYYPPPSAPNKREIPADDPNNPLGEHWIGLEGIEGDAVGQEGYGIHGTIEPESIGRAVSLGCIRMHNEDIAFFYKLMLPGRSTVTILP